MKITAFADNTELLLAVEEYGRNALTAYHTARLRPGKPGYRFRDTVLRPEDIDSLLLPDYSPKELAQRRSQAEALAGQRAQLRLRAGAAMEEEDEFLPLEYLAQVASLDDFDYHCLCLALLTDLDPRFERVWGFMADDLACRRPTMHLLLRSYTAEASLSLLARLQLPGPVQRLLYRPPAASLPPLSATAELEPRVRRFLLGEVRPSAEEQQAHYYSYLPPPERFCPIPSAAGVQAALEQVYARVDGQQTTLIQLFGPDGAGKKLHARRYAALGGQGILALDVAALAAEEEQEDHLRAFCLELMISQGLPALTHLDEWLEAAGDSPAAWQWLSSLIGRLSGFALSVLLLWRTRRKLSGLMPPLSFYDIEVPPPDGQERLALWQALLPEGTGIGEEALSALAGKFALTPGQIAGAVADALRTMEEGGLSAATLTACSRRQLLHTLERHARPVATIFSWDDLILPAEPKMLLRRAVDQARYRQTVMEDWGFARKLPYGRGMALVFYGPSGTGKTMAAQVMAGDLGLELYKVDLSCVVSKYIGETEQNLRLVFDEAQKGQAVLFFDEADSLFGKRTEVKDSHDKNANMEVSFLLQKLEEHDGIVVLSTNFMQNIDNAFRRRVHYMIEFTQPDEAQRLLLWQSMLPEGAPTKRLDYAYLAKNFELTGANIKSIVVSAAYDAAAKGEAISMAHIITALRIESKKLGSLLTAADFGNYASLCAPWA